MTAFIDQYHENFYQQHMAKLPNDCYYRPLVYLIGLTADTRIKYGRIFGDDGIDPICLTDGWQTGTTQKIVRLAYNLFNGCAVDSFAAPYPSHYYAPDELFCSNYAPYFVEAIKLRYPDFFCKN